MKTKWIKDKITSHSQPKNKLVIELKQKRWENIHIDSRQLSQMPKCPESLKRNEWPTIMKRCTHITCSSLPGKHANIFEYFKAYKSKMWSNWHILNMWVSLICISFASICLKVDQEEQEDTWTQQPHVSVSSPILGSLNFANLVLFHQSRHQQNVRVFTEKLHYYTLHSFTNLPNCKETSRHAQIFHITLQYNFK